MRKFKNIASWVSLFAYLIVVLSLISANRKEIICKKIVVSVNDDTQNYFVEEADVMKLLNNKKVSLIGALIDTINTNKLEEVLSVHSAIKEANVYRNLDGDLHIRIEQRNPIVRVINRNGESFYIDDEGALMPLSTKYAAHVLVANGNIKDSYAKNYTLNLSQKNDTAVENSHPLLVDLYQLADYIYRDEFWNAQIEQIYVNGQEFELVPRVGTHIIELGTLENYKNKFRNLRLLYEQGLPKAGWNKYKTINLKYNNQVICTKR